MRQRRIGSASGPSDFLSGTATAGAACPARATARARGRTGGRHPVLSAAKLAHAQELRDGGQHTMSAIAELVGCSRATLYWALDGQAAEAAGVPR